MEERVPAWMLCVDMLNKLKRELVNQAMDTLDGEVAAGRVDIKGSLIDVPDQSNETDMKLFVIGRMLQNVDQMREAYGKYIDSIDSKGRGASAIELQNQERAKLFMLAVEKISILVNYGGLLEAWINDASMLVGAKSLADIVKKTAAGRERLELVRFVLKNRAISEGNILSREERKSLESAV